MNASKPFKTIDEQIQILQSRGIEIDTDAKKILGNENYYNVINGYKDPFLVDATTNPDGFLPGTRFSEIYCLYLFDRRLRSAILSQLLIIERHIKAKIAHEFARVHDHQYLLPASFNVFLPGTGVSAAKMQTQDTYINELIAEINKELNDPKNKYVIHYMQNYPEVPIWVLINSFTMGTTSKFFKLMRDSEKNAIGREYGMNPSALDTALHYVSFFRNLCAHDQRLYNERTVKRSIVATPIHAALSIPTNSSGNYIKGINDVFALIIIFKQMTALDEFILFITEIKESVKWLESNLQSINIEVILDRMGFPSNWLDISHP
jgi:abortive infection bacteriophage resistance protein